MQHQPDQAVILVGGLGTRLGGLTTRTPKPLLHVGGQPFLDYLIHEVGRHGCKHLLLLAQFESEQVKAYAQTSRAVKKFGLKVDVAIEPDKAGTGGSLWHARNLLHEVFWLLNGDSWLESNLLALGDVLQEDLCQAVATLRRVDDGGRYGVVDLNGKLVTKFGNQGMNGKAALINGGVYLMRRSLVDRLQPNCSLEEDVFPKIAASGELRAIKSSGFFIDIGIPETFEAAQITVPKHFQRPALFLDRDGVVNVDHGYVGTKERFEWQSGAIKAIRNANNQGWLVFIVTNQAGVARGYYSEADVDNLHNYMQQELRAFGAHIDAFRYCPHHPEALTADYARECSWRKPNAGMIEDILTTWPVDVVNSAMVGDKDSDIRAAQSQCLRAELYDGSVALDDFIRMEFNI
jgi:D,D-heptose 1,7-bisphosphate phosphatase